MDTYPTARSHSSCVCSWKNSSHAIDSAPGRLLTISGVSSRHQVHLAILPLLVMHLILVPLGCLYGIHSNHSVVGGQWITSATSEWPLRWGSIHGNVCCSMSFSPLVLVGIPIFHRDMCPLDMYPLDMYPLDMYPLDMWTWKVDTHVNVNMESRHSCECEHGK